MTLELPSRLMADRAALLLIAIGAVVAEVVLHRLPEGPAGLGLVAGAWLAAWQAWRMRAGRQVLSATLGADGGWRLVFGDGRSVPARLVRGSRLLGPTAVLKWTVEGCPRAVWLTPADLPRTTLRALRVRLAGASPRAGT
jgi:hypothetical protein